MAVVPHPLPVASADAALIAAACAAIETAPAPGWIVARSTVRANAAARRWLREVDAALDAVADADLPARHWLTASLQRAASEAAASSGEVALDLGAVHGGRRSTLVAHALVSGSALPIVAWLRTEATAPADEASGNAPARRELLTRLQAAERIANVGIWEANLREGREYYDDECCRMLGFGPGPQVRPPSDFEARLHPDDVQRVAANYERSLTDASSDPQTLAFRIILNGEVRHLLSRHTVERSADGTAQRALGTMFDVTELRAAEHRARELANQLELAQASAGIGVWDWRPGTDGLERDARTYALCDLPVGTPVSFDRFRSMVPDEDMQRIDQALQRSVRDGTPFDMEFRIRTSTGQQRVIAARGEVVERDARGSPARMIGVNWDVTERRAAEARAREATDRLQLAATGAGIGCWERAIASGRVVWDAQMHALFGTTPADGDPEAIWRRLVLPEDIPSIDRARAQALRSGEYAVTYRVRRPDGALRWLAARGRTHLDGDGQPLHIVGVCWDMTEAHAHDAALRAKETAERANQAKSEFLSRMSHELRTPLNAIVGFTQLLELDRAEPLSDRQRERVGLIRSSGWHLLNLINDVLDLARIESGKSTVAMDVVPWAPVVDEAIAMVRQEADSRGVEIALTIGAACPATVWGDPVRLRQVLLNLLSNAVKYNRDRGRVDVDVRGSDASVVVTVRDTGRGMSPGQMSRLFQPFNRLGLDSAAPPGTGIGLALSQRLMQQMEGAIEVDSTLGVGSEFRARLRVARVEPLAARPVTAAPDPLAIREDIAGTLLYIEDNPANSALVEQFLQFRPRVKLYQAADGATGLVMAAVSKPDLVLIDIRLPDMLGDELLRRLQQQPETRGLACIAVSANAMPDDIRAALDAGFVDYWTKPLDVTAFLRGIDRLLAVPTGREAGA